MVAGPGMAGTAVASAHWFGVHGHIHDLFDHKKKKKKKSDRGAKVGAQRHGGPKKSGGGVGGPKAPSAPKTGATKVGAGDGFRSAARTGSFAESPQPASAGRAGQSPSAVVSGGTAQAPSAVVTGGTTQAPSTIVTGGTAQSPAAAVSGGGGGGGGVPLNGNISRAPNLAPVPTAPSSRKIVIRSAPPKAPAAPAPAAPVAPVAPAPVVVPPAPVVVPPAPVITAPAPSGAPPAAPIAPVIPAPRSAPPAAQLLSGPAAPESFRLGYTDYLRTASTSDLLFAVLPGLGAMVLMTAAGGVVGFRQARAAQTLPSPQIARFLP